MASGGALAVVCQNGGGKGSRAAIVKEAGHDANTPERSCSHFALAGARLGDAVSETPHVVKQKVGVGEEGHVVKHGNRVWPGLKRGEVTVGASDRLKRFGAASGCIRQGDGRRRGEE